MITNIRNGAAYCCHRIASHLTDPVCNAREYKYAIITEPQLHPEAYRVTNLFRQIYCSGLMVLNAVVALVTAPLGIVLRKIGAIVQTKPFFYRRGDAAEKIMQGNTFTHLLWNVALIGAGYCGTDAGVIPRPRRIQRIAAKILQKDADVVTLCEVQDIRSAEALMKALKGRYAHFYYHIGPKAMGVNSEHFIASKYRIVDPQFSIYPDETIAGRTKGFAAKGIFSFGLPFAHMFLTHPQHSEEPDHPTDEEKTGRADQREILWEKAQAVQGPKVFTGDFNADDTEMGEFFDAKGVQVVKENPANYPRKTWGGDAWCAKLSKTTPDGGVKRVSEGQNLDHTFALQGDGVRSIRTELVETGFDPKVYSDRALSDHEGLLSTIELG